MKIIALKPFNNKVFYKNAVFNKSSLSGSPYLIAARKLLAKKNTTINTIDTVNEASSQKDVYMDVPYPWEIKQWVRIIKNSKKSILFIVEPPIVNPFNFMRIFHRFFSKIYTWNDYFIDNSTYFKFYHPKTIEGRETKQVPFKQKKFLILMNGNVSPFFPFRLLCLSTRELYTERVRAIDFFDTHSPFDFYLYGKGWNKPQRFNLKQKLFGYKKYKTYQGKFDSKDKYKILSKFKFCICFENCIVEGYISEKIFDCFKASCVPIYLGAPNIKMFISDECFIDYRNFENYKQLLEFLGNMDEKTYNNYIKAIKKLILSKDFELYWSINAFAKIFEKSIT